MELDLGLFPLNAVLLPGADIRLHIFEDRYKEMIARCIRERRPFGVVLDRNRNETVDALDPVAIGTTAVIREVTKLPQGRLYIVAHGGQRFKVTQVLDKQPFWRAEVVYLPEPLGPADSASRLRETAHDQFKDYLQALLALSGGELEGVVLPDDAVASSYLIADALQVDLSIKQQLLETATTAERLRAELMLLDRETRRVRGLRMAQPAPDPQPTKTPFDVKFSLN